VLKRLLQVAWATNNMQYEMLAYELTAKQYFYLSDMHKASYYLDRVMRGKFEVKSSKVRVLAMLQY